MKRKLDESSRIIPKAIIFDFDGTIVDTENFIINIYNKIVERYNYKINRIEVKDIPAFRKMKGLEIFKKLNITPFNLPFIAAKMHNLIRKQITDIQLHYGMRDLITQIKSKKYITCILSTNNSEIIKNFLKHNQLESFDYIFSCKKIFGKDKALEKTIRKLKLKKENVIYIGDEIRDITASHKVGIKIISVSWGFNDREALEKENPEYIIETPIEVLNII